MNGEMNVAPDVTGFVKVDGLSILYSEDNDRISISQGYEAIAMTYAQAMALRTVLVRVIGIERLLESFGLPSAAVLEAEARAAA